MKTEDIRILVVDDQPNVRALVERILSRQGYTILGAEDGTEALKVVESDFPDLVLMDIQMPRLDGIQTLKRLMKLHPTLPVIMMSGFSDVRSAVEAMKLGARNYLMVPFETEDLIVQVNRALEETQVKREMGRLQTIFNDSTHLCELMGYSSKIQAIYEQISTVAITDFTVIIYGESGSGKELVARAIHRCSNRSDGPFVPVDCGSIPENLIESELFGHERGSFTGAYQQKLGSFERASGGTLFLDEICNLPRTMQAKLLRALQEKTIERIGGTKPLKTDIRVIAASNRRLETLISEGKFREDLYHRLNEFLVEIPPLRKRKDDLIYLAKRFMDATAKELNKQVRGISDGAIQMMLDHDWPGNVRELRNTIRRAVLLCEDIIRPQDMTALAPAKPEVAVPAIAIDVDNDEVPLRKVVKDATRELEQKLIGEVLTKTGGNKSKAARILQVDYKTILQKIKNYGLDSDRQSK